MSAQPASGATNVRPDAQLKYTVANGAWRDFTVKASTGETISGTFNDDHTVWTSTGKLLTKSKYTASGTYTDGRQTPGSYSAGFSTLEADHLLIPSIRGIEENSVRGVAMPIVVNFNHEVDDAHKAAVAKAMVVSTSTPVEGAWHWFSDDEVHWRPKSYWPTSTKVTVNLNLQGVQAADGLWGRENWTKHFSIAAHAVTSFVNLDIHQMYVYVDGKLTEKIPVTGGKSGYRTRYGVKLIMEKFPIKRMDAATTGTDPKDPEYYNIPDVKWAQRVTDSGEFLHAAPWSVDEQGEYNVSHGCVGMSTKRAHWFYNQTHIGDPVTTTGTNRKLTPAAGAWDDWNIPWSYWASNQVGHGNYA